MPDVDVEIEKGIPIPNIERCGGRPTVYPWDKLEIGDSFIIRVPRMGARLQQSEKRYGKKYVSRKVEEGVYRIWRVE